MRIACKEQHTSEWFDAKIGKVSASNMYLAMDFVSKGSIARGDKRIESSAARNKYIRHLAMEMITREPTEHYVSPAMDHGTGFESEARRAYALRRECMVDQTGFVLHPTLNYLGASPDGVILPTHIVELKCPTYDIHLEYLDTGIFPKRYILQVHCVRLCCKSDYGELVSYYAPDPQLDMPYLPERFRMVIKRIEADAEIDRQMEEAATKTMEEATALVERLCNQYPELESKRAQVEKAELEGGITDADIAAVDPSWKGTI